MKTVQSTCTRDCPGSCSILATREGDTITSLSGNRDHGYTQGFLCLNTKNYLGNRFYSPQRILHPLQRVNGKWVRISWEEALDRVVDQLQHHLSEYGGSSILYYQGFGARTALRILNRRFFNLLGGVSTLHGTVCGGIGQYGQEQDLGIRISHDPQDYFNSKHIFIWGRNLALTDIHLWKILKKAKRQGSSLITIDPMHSATAAASDYSLQPKPGSDAYIALAMAKIILKEGWGDLKLAKEHSEGLEEYIALVKEQDLTHLTQACDLSLDEIHKLASLYVDGPSSIITGWGLHRYYQGHLVFRLLDALAMITMNLGRSGGGVSQGFEEYGFFDDTWAAEHLNKNGRKLFMPIIGEELEKASPPVRMVFLTAANPVVTSPNSLKVKNALEGVDFLVVVDHFMTDTAQLADIFLPATTFLEDEDLVGSYGHNWISPLNPVVQPQGECRSELWIFQQIAHRMGLRKEMKGSSRDWLEKLAKPLFNHGFRLNDLMEKPHRVPCTPLVPYHDGKFPTTSGKFQFITEFKMVINEEDDYPFRLLSLMPRDWIGSEINPAEFQEGGFLEVEVHPQILFSLGLEDGDQALLQSKVGELEVLVRKNLKQRCDVISTYRGGWLSLNKCVNVLTRDMLSEAGSGTPYHETWVNLLPF